MTCLKIAALFMLTLGSVGCATTYSGEEVGSYMADALEASKVRVENGDAFEAYALQEAVRAVDPDFPGLPARFSASDELATLFDRPLIGSNVALRKPGDKGVGTTLLWYIPNRVLDILDVFSFDIHFGTGLFVDVHATRAVSLGLGGRTVGGVGWHYGRSLGIQSQTQAAALAPMVGFETYSAFKSGINGANGGSWSIDGVQGSNEDLYREYRDFWSVGAAVTAGVVGVDVDVHLFQILDLGAGLFTFDPGNDDLGRTEPLDLDADERTMVLLLREMSASEESMDHYKVWAASNAAGDGEPN